MCSVQFNSVAQSCPTFCDPMNRSTQASLSITISRSLLRLTSIESVMPSSHPILGRPLLLLPPIPASIRVFSNESTLCMRWPKYWSFSFSISPSKEIPGLISFRMDWLDLLSAQGTLHVYLWLIHVDVWQKPKRHCKAIVLNLKYIIFLKDQWRNVYLVLWHIFYWVVYFSGIELHELLVYF